MQPNAFFFFFFFSLCFLGNAIVGLHYTVPTALTGVFNSCSWKQTEHKAPVRVGNQLKHTHVQYSTSGHAISMCTESNIDGDGLTKSPHRASEHMVATTAAHCSDLDRSLFTWNVLRSGSWLWETILHLALKLAVPVALFVSHSHGWCSGWFCWDVPECFEGYC